MKFPLQSAILSNIDFANLARKRAITKSRGRVNIGYIGAVGDKNLGDTAMLDAVREHLPATNIELLQPEWCEKRLAKLGLSGPSYFNKVLLGGGTLISPYWLNYVEAAQALGIPVATCGTGVGSSGFGEPETVGLEEWKPSLERFSSLGVRGPLSQARLQAVGLTNAQIVGDLALLYTGKTIVEKPKKSVALNVAWSQGAGEKNHEAFQGLERVVRSLHGAGWGIVPIAMHQTDVEPLKQFLESAIGSVPVIHQPRTAQEFFALVQDCTCSLAVRLHMAILSCCVGVPPLMLGYRDKCVDFMDSMKLQNWHLKLQEVSATEVQESAMSLTEIGETLRYPIWQQAQFWQQKLEPYVESLAKKPKVTEK
jgi:polysaccharide pyruvyl transferase WcaK-like protein